MGETEKYIVNDTIRAIRKVQEDLQKWADGNPCADPRHVAMVRSKLEEAELLAQRIVRND